MVRPGGGSPQEDDNRRHEVSVTGSNKLQQYEVELSSETYTVKERDPTKKNRQG